MFGVGGLVLQIGVLVEVADALAVLLQGDGDVAGLEGLVAEILAVGRDLEAFLCRVGGRWLVFGEVFVFVAVGVGGAGRGVEGDCVWVELAAVGDYDVFFGLVGLGGEVLDQADDGLAGEDLAEDDVLVV